MLPRVISVFIFHDSIFNTKNPYLTELHSDGIEYPCKLQNKTTLHIRFTRSLLTAKEKKLVLTCQAFLGGKKDGTLVWHSNVKQSFLSFDCEHN